jgi:hypothetical protein
VIEKLITVNSVYEIDHDHNQITMPDGEKREFTALLRRPNGGMVFYWPNGTCTVTSMGKEQYDRL